jgi:hypothetical protein
MNTRLINPRQRLTTLNFELGLTTTSASFQFVTDAIIHGVTSSARIDNFVAGTTGAIACGFDIGQIAVRPGTPERSEGIVHFYQSSLPITGLVAPSSVMTNNTDFDAMFVLAGTKFVVQTATTGGLVALGGVFTVRWNPISEWLNFVQPIAK